ncbi:hypothetical protein C8R45DRAFT_1037492 [Mycena sanguinolenta]|nr:hypothetical protein C8R45DRAFT_1037492 [Mycena sanguinolenta]
MPASFSNLPEEILAEILFFALRVSDAAFSALSVTGDSPFVSFRESSSAYLRVSKGWLRVATPFLYKVVIIRSKAQAQALAATLSSNPALGRYIKKLRVEGGYAISMLKVLESSKNLTDLFLSADVAHSDNASGLCRGLPLVDPVRVILDMQGLSMDSRKLVNALRKCIPTWKKLAQFEMSDVYEPRDRKHSAAEKIISTALRNSLNLRTLVVWDLHVNVQCVPHYMTIAAANPALKTIQIKPSVAPQHSRSSHRMALYTEMKKNMRLNALLDLTDEIPVFQLPAEVPDSLAQLPSTFVYPAQLTGNPVQEDNIWSRVLFFALESQASGHKWDFARPHNAHFSRLSPLLVCRKFAQLGIPHLYKNVVLNREEAARSFMSQLAQQPTLGYRVRSLLLNYSRDITLKFKTTIAYTPALNHLDGGKDFLPIFWKDFCDLSNSVGSTLRSFRGIQIDNPDDPKSPDVFARFTQLEDFHWFSRTAFKTDHNLTHFTPVTVFNTLVHLRITVCYHESFMTVLAHMELPSLRTTVFSYVASGGAPFFKKHGAKLSELSVSTKQLTDPGNAIWLNCPFITVLGVSFDQYHPVTASCLTTVETLARLERIVFNAWQFPPPDRSTLTKEDLVQLGHLMAALRTTTSFPALREIEHPMCTWPRKERHIPRSFWVKWAESMLERGVHLFGSDKVHWRPRLKYVPKKRTNNGD